MIDDSIAELEEGFRDLLAGVLATVKVLREENVMLRARLDELRHYGTRAEQLLHVVPQLPAPTNQSVTRPCQRCGVPTVMDVRGRYCLGCRTLQRQEALKRCRQTKAARAVSR